MGSGYGREATVKKAKITAIGQCFKNDKGLWDVSGWGMEMVEDVPFIAGESFCGWAFVDLAAIAALHTKMS